MVAAPGSSHVLGAEPFIHQFFDLDRTADRLRSATWSLDEQSVAGIDAVLMKWLSGRTTIWSPVV